MQLSHAHKHDAPGTRHRSGRSFGWLSLMAGVMCLFATGCTLIPDRQYAPQHHNPFPQLKRIAIVPFFNQSENPYVNGQRVAESYYQQLQQIPGFEVIPIGVTMQRLRAFEAQRGQPSSGADWQAFAAFLGAEAVVVGSVTDFDSYYPPRMGMAVRWYAADSDLHPVPPGYGLPWGTPGEKHISPRVRKEAEFHLARAQIKSQRGAIPASGAGGTGIVDAVTPMVLMDPAQEMAIGSGLPANWPTPTDLIPDGPSVGSRPQIPQSSPVFSHTALYRGDDSYVTKRLADYVSAGDDARSIGWQGYL
ncbi:MAG: hypothetical protein AAFP69_23870, partial [Planctomycetota bacterium]